MTIAADPDAFEAIAMRGPSALAWEVLRRDPAYVADYEVASAAGAPGRAADTAFVARWGLHFP